MAKKHSWQIVVKKCEVKISKAHFFKVNTRDLPLSNDIKASFVTVGGKMETFGNMSTVAIGVASWANGYGTVARAPEIALLGMGKNAFVHHTLNAFNFHRATHPYFHAASYSNK